MTALRKHVRRNLTREEEPSAAIIDSKSIKTSAVRGSDRGFDAGKNLGTQTSPLVDTQGFVLAVKVLTAYVTDREGAKHLLGERGTCFPRISHLFADYGYTGLLRDWIKERLQWDTEIVPKPTNDSPIDWALVDGEPVKIRKPKGGFQVQRRRWVIERTFAWKWACS